MRQVGEHLADQRGRAGVHPPGRLVDHQYLWGAVQLAPHHELLQVAAGQGRGRRVVLTGAHVEPFGDPRRRAACPGTVDEAGAHHAGLGGVTGQQHVVREHEARHRAVAESFLGHEGGAELPACGYVARTAALAGDGDRLRRRCRAATGERLEQLGLAVACHPGDRHHLAGAHLQRDVAQRYPERPAGRQREVGDGQQRLPANAVAGGVHVVHVGADHQPRQRGGALGLRISLGHHLAAAQDGGVVAQPPYLVQPVRDVQHRAAVVGQPAQGNEQPVRLLRRKHRGRLIHDQQPWLLQQAAHDLDPLSFADRQGRDQRGRLQRQAILARHARDSRGERGRIERAAQGEGDVLHYGERLEQREVLEHHGDAEPPGGRRIGDGDRPPTPVQAARGRLQRAVHDLDQGRLAGAVLAEQGVDPAGAQAQGDPVIGGEIAEQLHDVARLQEVLAAGLASLAHPSSSAEPVC